MKTFAISLKRSNERRNYIENHLTDLQLEHEILDAVDGAMLSDADIQNSCNVERLNEFKSWLSPGAIGCALSHLAVYQKIVEQGLSAALVVEDDAVLPANIKDILAEISLYSHEDEIILFYYSAFQNTFLSSVRAEKTKYGQLLYPLDLKQTLTATAYLVGRKAALGLIRANFPVNITADCWHQYYELKAFSRLRVLYPRVVDTKNFKSSIDYISHTSLIGKLLSAVDTYKIPILFQIVKWRRRRRKMNMLNKFKIAKEPSHIMLDFEKVV